MNLRTLYQDNGQTEMETIAITFGLLKQSTHEQWSMVNGGTHDKRFNTYNFRRSNLLRILFFKRLQKKTKRKKTRKIKCNQNKLRI